MSKKEELKTKTLEILENHPDGLHYANLKRELQKHFPSMKHGTVDGYLWKVHETTEGEIVKPRRGLFVLKKYYKSDFKISDKSSEKIAIPEEEGQSTKFKEEEFYLKFAEYLMTGISECNSAVPFGDSRGGPKWGNPDVIGWFDIGKAIFTQNPEIVSGELKIDSSWDKIVTGFGQACSYLLFSHKSYLAIPKQIKEGDRSRIESLCIIFGIGLIYFDKDDPKDPKFELRNRALRHEPNILYINERAKDISDELTKSNHKGV